MKPALTACDYCRRDYPHAARTRQEIDWQAYQQQSAAALYNAQAQCNQANLYAQMGAQQNSLLGMNGQQFCNHRGLWP
jgi:hypothetical protein